MIMVIIILWIDIVKVNNSSRYGKYSFYLIDNIHTLCYNDARRY